MPPNYHEQKKYPVLYVLHSYKLNENHWFQDLGVTQTADELIAAGKIEPMIIVAPRIDNSFGVNSAELPGYIAESGKPGDEGVLFTGKYEDYITKDVVNYVDQHFKTISSRKGRYLGGTSMGGFAALHIGFNHPELYSKVGGHAPALLTGDLWPPLAKLVFPTTAAREHNDPLALAASRNLHQLNIYLDCGDQDDFKQAVADLDGLLKGRKTASYQYQFTPGGRHDDAYWRSQMVNYLMFYGNTHGV